MPRLLTRARRRQLTQVIFEQTGIAVAVAFGGFVLLLLLGTQVLDWYWLVLLFGGSLAVGITRTINRVPSRYRLAQIVDERLNLHDTISTALHFEKLPRPSVPMVCDQAEQAARRADLTVALPYRWPRALYAASGVALVACGMFALRYGITRSLDLKPSLVKIAFDSFIKTDTAQASGRTPLQRIQDALKKKLGVNVNRPDTPSDQPQNTPDSAVPATEAKADEGQSGDSAKSEVHDKKPPQQQPTDLINNGQKGDQTGSMKDQPSQDQSDQQGNNDGGQPDGKPQMQQKTADGSPKSNMLDKMRDAMSNLLSKLKSQPKSGEGKQQQAQNGQQQKGQGQQNQQQSEQSGQQQQNGSNSQDQRAQQQGGNQGQQTAQGKASGKSSDQNDSKDAKSGIGKEDGDKAAREAEQLRAMGKISEIFGKRSQNMSGEVMVEVASGNQQLKTQYTSKSAEHTEAGGEISRDEVPFMYQQYVQEYFEQIRKTPPPAKKSK